MACLPVEVQTDLGCIPTTVGGFVGKLYQIGLGMIGATALLFIIYGGYLLMTSRGNQEQIKKGKSYIFYAIVGVLVAVLGMIFYEVIAVNILKIPGIGS